MVRAQRGHRLLNRGVHVDLRGRQVRVPQDPLDVGQRQRGIPGHPVRGGMPQVMQRPVGAEQRVRPLEHPVRSVVGQGGQRLAQRPPQRLPPPRGYPAAHLLLVKTQPDERVRRGGQLLSRPRPLPDHRDQLLTRVGIPLAGAEQLTGPRPGRDPERHQRPVPVRGKRREQQLEHLIRDPPRRPPRHRAAVPSFPLPRPRVHRVVMGMRTPAAPRPVQRERVDHRPAACFPVKVVERP